MREGASERKSDRKNEMWREEGREGGREERESWLRKQREIETKRMRSGKSRSKRVW